MDDLPPEILVKIFKQLRIDQILKVRQVNKRFNAVINENVRLKSLVIAPSGHFVLNRKWLDTKQLVSDISDQLIVPELDSILLFMDPPLLSQPMFTGIKQLYIISKVGISDSVDSSIISSIYQLEHLELINTSILGSEEDVDLSDDDLDDDDLDFWPSLLNSTSLKVLNLESPVSKLDITFNTPRLTRVRILSADDRGATFNHPESIKHFEILTYQDYIRTFSNLEYLYVREIEWLENDFLLKLPLLKEIHLSVGDQAFGQLLKQKQKLGRKQLKIYYLGSELTDLPDELDENHSVAINEYTIGFYETTNLEQFADVLPFIRKLNYSALEYANLNDGALRCLVKKLVNLNNVVVNQKVKNANLFIDAFTGCNAIEMLDIGSFCFKQGFYDTMIYRLFPTLSFFVIRNHPNLNYDFLLKFSNLEHVYISHESSDELIRKLFNRYSSLSFHFTRHNYRISIQNSFDELELELPFKRDPMKFANFDKLFDYFKELDFSKQDPSKKDPASLILSKIDFDDLDLSD